MGLEPSAPMTFEIEKGTDPIVEIFPNDWITGTTNAYTNWQENDDKMQSSVQSSYKQSGPTYFYQPASGTNGAANAFKRHYIKDYSSADENDDKLSYRLVETNWNSSENDWKHGGSVVTWYPENAKHQDFIWTVPTGQHEDGGLILTDIGGPGTSDALNIWLSGSPVDFFGFTVPTIDTNVSWQGTSDIKTLFYRASFVLDGYQETVFVSDVAKKDGINNTPGGAVTFTAYLDDSALNKRVTSVAIYRAYHSSDDSDPDAPDTLYRFLQEVKLRDFNWSDTNNRLLFPFKDT